MKSKISKIAIMLIVFCMSLALFAINGLAADTSSSDKIDSCEREVREYDANQVKKYLAGENTYPELKGYIFAGWYTDEECSNALRGKEPTDSAYALFVPEDVLSVKAQVSAHLVDGIPSDDDNKASIRFVTTVDSLRYQKVGFEVSYIKNGELVSKNSKEDTIVYEKLYVVGSAEKVWEKTPQSEFCGLSQYFRAYSINNVPVGNYDTEFTVKPYWVTLDGDKVYGIEATKKINDGLLSDEVYVSSNDENKKDDPFYGSYEYPYETLDYAISQVADGGTVRIKDNVTPQQKWAKSGKKITITGYDGDSDAETLDLSSYTWEICFNNSVTFKDITLKLNKASGKTIVLVAGGYDLVIEEDVILDNAAEVASGTVQLQLLGGTPFSTDEYVESTNMKIYAGTYTVIYGGGSGGTNVLGDVSVTVGKNVNPEAEYTDHDDKKFLLFGAGYSGTVYGDTNVKVEDGATFTYIFGGGQTAESVVKGEIKVEFAGEAMSIYGGGKSGINGDTQIIMNSGKVEQLFGGCEANSMVGNTDVQVLGGQVDRRIFGGCYNVVSATGSTTTAYAVTGNTNVLVGPNATLNFNKTGPEYTGDVSLCAISRGSTSAYDNEWGSFIINQDSSYKGRIEGFWTKPACHYLVTTNGNNKTNTLGNVTSAGDCIRITPKENYAATVTIDGVIKHYTEQESCYMLPALDSKTSTEEIVVTFSPISDGRTDAQTAFINSAEAKIGTAYYDKLAGAIAAAERMQNAQIVALNTSQSFSTITIENSQNGTVTTDKKNCIAGETVTLTVKPDEGYYLTGLSVKNAEVNEALDFAGGTYTFVTTDRDHTVRAEFTRIIFKEDATWNLLNQYQGTVSIPSTREGDPNWLWFYDDYADMDLTLTVRDYDSSNTDEAQAVDLRFANGQYIRIRVTNDADTKGTHMIQTMDGIRGWSDAWNMSDSEIASYQSAEGLKFRVVRRGTDMHLYLNGVQKCTIDLTETITDGVKGLSGITANMKATVGIKSYTNTGYDVTIPFVMQDTVSPVVLDFKNDKASDNGTLKADNAVHYVGETVTLRADAADGYYCKEMKIDGKTVEMNWDGTYSFVATDAVYSIEGTFAEKVFVGSVNGASLWNVNEQNQGTVAMSGDRTGTKGVVSVYTNTGNAPLAFAKNYTDIDLTMTVKDNTDITSAARTGVKFDFTDGSTVAFTILKDGEDVIIQTMNGSGTNEGPLDWQTLGKFSSVSATAKENYYNGTGAEFRVVRKGTQFFFAIDGEACGDGIDIKTYDGYADITAETEATVSLLHYDDAGVWIDIPFTVADTVADVPEPAWKSGDWNISTRYLDMLTLNAGSTTENVTYVGKGSAYTTLDFAIKVKEENSSKAQLEIKFKDGNDWPSIYRFKLQSQDDETYITMAALDTDKTETKVYTLTAAEALNYKSEGINFRLVRDGLRLALYIDNSKCYLTNSTYDVCENGEVVLPSNEYIDKDCALSLIFYYWRGATESVDFPYVLKHTVEPVTLTSEPDT